jgi:hypothetical protein
MSANHREGEPSFDWIAGGVRCCSENGAKYQRSDGEVKRFMLVYQEKKPPQHPLR